MFNVAVFKMKDMIRYLIYIILTLLIIIIASKYITKNEKETLDISKKINTNIIKTQIQKLISQNYKPCINTELSSIKKINEKQETKNEETPKEKNYMKKIITTEIGSIKKVKEKPQEQTNQEQTEQEQPQEEQKELATTGEKTEIITNNPIEEKYNAQYGNVKIKNGTNIQLTEEIMNPNITIENKNILIFHTHSCESYTSSDSYPYTPTGNFRTTDLNYSVTRVGTELETYLKQYGIPTVHNTSYHDYPAYNGSYTRSLQTVETMLQTTPSDIIIDLHRDAIGSRSDYAPIVKIGDDVAAQIMYVIGTDQGGLEHPNWQQNLKFAIKVQQKAEEMYPGLFKPLMLTEYRYNQHAGKYASIMEVGATGNTLEQCLTSMKYLSKVLDEVINK